MVDDADEYRSMRFDAALRELGDRYAKRGGFITPLDIRAVCARWSASAEEAATLEAWLSVQLEL